MSISLGIQTESATLTSKGQVTIPVHVRESLGIHQGDHILFVADAGGTYRIQAKRKSHHEFAGMLNEFATKPYSEVAFKQGMQQRLHSKFSV